MSNTINVNYMTRAYHKNPLIVLYINIITAIFFFQYC